MIKWDMTLNNRDLVISIASPLWGEFAPQMGQFGSPGWSTSTEMGGESSAKMKDCGSQSILIIRNGDELETVDIIRYPKPEGIL